MAHQCDQQPGIGDLSDLIDSEYRKLIGIQAIQPLPRCKLSVPCATESKDTWDLSPIGVQKPGSRNSQSFSKFARPTGAV